MNMDDSWFMEWRCKEATDEEIALFEKVADFQEQFDDMLFQEINLFSANPNRRVQANG